MTQQQPRAVVTAMSGLDTYQTLMISGMLSVLSEQGLALLAHLDDTTVSDIPPELLSMIRAPETCGVIYPPTLSAHRDQALVGLLRSLGLPAVHLGQNVRGEACVRADNEQGMSELMALLLDQCGVRAPGLAKGLDHQSDHVTRERVFRREMARRGLPVDEDLIIQGRADLDLTRRETQRLIASGRHFDALVTMDDWAALQVVEALLGAGIRVPEDVVVTGFDNYPAAAISWPTLTTVDQNLEEQGATASRILLDHLAGRGSTDHVYTRCRVIPRGSTAVGQARLVTQPQTTETVTQATRLELSAQGNLLRTGRALMRCRSLEDIWAALADNMPQLGIKRAFLVLYEDDAPAPIQHPDGDTRARLVLDYRDQTAHQPSPRPFSARDLLPPPLRAELFRGFLALQPLRGVQGPMGYLLMEPSFDQAPINAVLRMDLNRTIDAVLRSSALEEHSRLLSRLVDQRTQELAAEAASRRQVEEELRLANAELDRSVLLDGLTGIANRTALDRHVAECWPLHVADQRELAVMMVDVDAFKAYNDHYGHLAGDEALRQVATCLDRAARRPHDLVCRFGGEEFLVLLPYSGISEATVVAQRFADHLERAAIAHAASPVADVITASVGIASLVPGADHGLRDLILIADHMLYLAKEQGRNRVVAGSDLDRSAAGGWAAQPARTLSR